MLAQTSAQIRPPQTKILPTSLILNKLKTSSQMANLDSFNTFASDLQNVTYIFYILVNRHASWRLTSTCSVERWFRFQYRSIFVYGFLIVDFIVLLGIMLKMFSCTGCAKQKFTEPVRNNAWWSFYYGKLTKFHKQCWQ